MRSSHETQPSDVVPLSQRVAAMMVTRTVVAAAGLGLGVLAGVGDSSMSLALTAGYIVLTGLLSVGALQPDRSWGVRLFGLALLVDGLFLQWQHERIGHGYAVDLLIVTHLVATCLLASFQTGLRATVWQSLLMVLALRLEQASLAASPGWRSVGATGDTSLAIDIALLWIVVLTASTTAAMNERELRRRRYDAEALQRFAGALHADRRMDEVATRLCEFFTSELDATRAVVCERTREGWRVDAASGLALGQPAASVGAESALLACEPGVDGEILAMRLDPAADPWLAAILPGAERLVAFPFGVTGQSPSWVVFEHGARRGSRIEARVLSTAAQAVATASLARSRTHLLERAERAAATDGLTSVANRRTFDVEIAALEAAWHRAQSPFALVMVDIDRFKSINDRFGHQMGDLVLQAVAATIVASCRPTDLPARYGGEEFAILLPGTRREAAAEIAERIRVALHVAELPVPVTASFGVAAVPEDSTIADDALYKADAALIHAKNSGRDRVVLASEAAMLPTTVDPR